MSKGMAFLLKIHDSGSYSTIAGLRLTGLTINNDPVDVAKQNDPWQKLESDHIKKSVLLSAGGIFLGSEAETIARDRAVRGSVDEYILSFEDGSKLTGKFMITYLEYLGDLNSERQYKISLSSSGEISHG